MSGILAIYNRDGRPVEGGILSGMLSAASSRAVDGTGIRLLGAAALAHQHCWAMPEEVGEDQPLVDPESGAAVAFDGRLDDRLALISELEVDRTGCTDAHLLLAAYRRWGPGLVDRILGDFAFVLWDPGQAEMVMARDALGTRGLSYYIDDRTLAVGSDVSALLRHPAVPDSIDETRIAMYLASDWHEQERTFFSHVRNVAPAHVHVITADGQRSRRYWDLDPDRRAPPASVHENADQLRALLARCTADRLRGRGPFAVSLSGGLDSTTVAALASNEFAKGQCRGAIRSYTYAFDRRPDCDERVSVRQVVERYGLDATYVPCDDLGPLTDIRDWPLEPDFVLFDAFALMPAAVRDAARADGCRTLLSGYFADILWWGGRYWLAEMVRDRHPAGALRTLVQGRHDLDWQCDVLERGLRQVVPARLKTAYRRRRPRDRKALAPLVSQGLARRTGLLEHLRDLTSPMPWRRAAGHQRQRDLVRGMRSVGISLTRRFYDRAGIDLADPYHDRRLVEFAMAVPAYHLGVPGRRKQLLALAMAQSLPDSVLARGRSQGLTPLLIEALAASRRHEVMDLMRAPLVRRMDLVSADWLESALRTPEVSPLMAYGLWLCVSLELWLRSKPSVALSRAAQG